MTQPRTFVLVGHCGPDMYMLRTAISRSVPGCAITSVNNGGALESHLNGTAVLLVNRALDGVFPAADGIELIRSLAQRANPPVMMLISNYAEAQQEAQSAGARPGFGKSQLYGESTAALLRSAAGWHEPAA